MKRNMSFSCIDSCLFNIFNSCTSRDKTSDEQDASISSLSPELLVKIFQQLPFTDRFKCRRVCKLWNQILKSNDNIYKRDLGQIYADQGQNCFLVRKIIGGDPDSREHKSKFRKWNINEALLAVLKRTAPFVPALHVCMGWTLERHDFDIWREIVKAFERRRPLALHTLHLGCMKSDDALLASMKRMVSLCSSLRDLDLYICSAEGYEQAWSILETVPPIQSLTISGWGFRYSLPSERLLSNIHRQLGPSLQRLHWRSYSEEVGKFLFGFPHLQELGLEICHGLINWTSVFDVIVTLSSLERLYFTFTDYGWKNDIAIGLKRIFDSCKQLKFIYLNIDGLRVPIFLDLLNHWSSARSSHGKRSKLKVELGKRCAIRETALAKRTFPAGVMVAFVY